MKTEMTKSEVRAMIRSDLDQSTIPMQVKSLYILANAVELLSAGTFMRIKGVFARRGIPCDSNELLSGLANYCRAVKMASVQFYKCVQPQIEGATFDLGHTPEQAAEAYDTFAEDSNELVRLFLLYTDRTGGNDRWRDVFTLLRKMPSMGYFKDEDFTRFKMKRYEG